MSEMDVVRTQEQVVDDLILLCSLAMQQLPPGGDDRFDGLVTGLLMAIGAAEYGVDWEARVWEVHVLVNQGHRVMKERAHKFHES